MQILIAAGQHLIENCKQKCLFYNHITNNVQNIGTFIFNSTFIQCLISVKRQTLRRNIPISVKPKIKKPYPYPGQHHGENHSIVEHLRWMCRGEERSFQPLPKSNHRRGKSNIIRQTIPNFGGIIGKLRPKCLVDL